MKITTRVVEQLSQLITAAFGFVAALAWNTAIQKWFESQPLISKGGPWVYAILVTVIAVAATVWISRIAHRLGVADERNEKK